MGGIFNINSPFFRVMSKVFDVIVLSLLWTLCCIPVITIGPATTALYYAIVKSIRKDRGYATKEFFKAFKMNFKQGAIVGVLLTVFGLILTVNLSYAKSLGSSFGSFLWYVYLVLGIALLMISLYVYPVLSRFTVTLKNLFKLSLFFAIRHIVTTVVALVIVVAGALLVYLSLLLALVFVPGVCTLLVSLLMERVLRRYTPDAEGSEDAPVDAWYME